MSATDAGATRLCSCGRTVAVPSLRELRQSAGEAVTRTPELLVRARLQSGERPPADCARCHGPTDRGIDVLADCEEPRSDAPGWGTVLLSFFLFGWLSAWLIQQKGERDARVVGERVAYDLPLRVCPDCRGRLHGSALWEAVSAVPEYRLLLDKYPDAKLSVVRDWPE